MTAIKFDTEDLTFLFHAIGIGAFKVPEVIGWCDRMIAEADQPDSRVIELSMAPKNIDEIQQHLIGMGAKSSLSEEMCLTIVAGGYFNARLDLKTALYHLYQYFCIDREEMTPLRQEVYLIDDEYDWDKSRAKGRLERLLGKYRQEFENFRERLAVQA